jgi:hypothetical protein
MAEENRAPLLLEYRAPLLLKDRAPLPAPGPAAQLPQSRAPRLLPLTLILGALLWLFTTTGGRHVFVSDMLGEAYDSQGENLLHGDATVDGNAIRHEVMIRDGRSYMYFGPFPAFVRLPLNYLYPKGHGHWSRISGFCAGIIALAAFSALVRRALSTSQLSTRWRSWIGNICLVGFAFASPLLLLMGDVSIYHEAIVWALAWSIAALYFAGRSRRRNGAALTLSLLAFSFCAGAALLSRVTFGAPLVLIAPIIGLTLLRRSDRITKLAALFLPLGAAVLFYMWLNYAKFGDPLGSGFKYYVNPTQREFAQKHGLFNVERVPYSFADYFFLRRPDYQPQPPFLRTTRAYYNHPDLYVMPFTETYSSLAWSSAWIILGALVGIGFLLWPKGSDAVERAIALILLAQVIAVLSFIGMAQRYTAEFFPFLICIFLLFLRNGRAVSRLRYVTIVLVLASVVINFFSTMSWLIESDWNQPPELRVIWSSFLRKLPDLPDVRLY